MDSSDPEYGAFLNWLFHADATLTFPQTVVLRCTTPTPLSPQDTLAPSPRRPAFQQLMCYVPPKTAHLCALTPASFLAHHHRVSYPSSCRFVLLAVFDAPLCRPALRLIPLAQHPHCPSPPACTSFPRCPMPDLLRPSSLLASSYQRSHHNWPLSLADTKQEPGVADDAARGYAR